MIVDTSLFEQIRGLSRLA